MNISARLLPEAGGDLISRYCSPRFAHARACIGRMPNSLAWLDAPVRAVAMETAGRVWEVVMGESVYGTDWGWGSNDDQIISVEGGIANALFLN